MLCNIIVTLYIMLQHLNVTKCASEYGNLIPRMTMTYNDLNLQFFSLSGDEISSWQITLTAARLPNVTLKPSKHSQD